MSRLIQIILNLIHFSQKIIQLDKFHNCAAHAFDWQDQIEPVILRCFQSQFLQINILCMSECFKYTVDQSLQ